MKNKQMKQAVNKVRKRLIVFLLYYFSTIAFGALLLFGLLKANVFLFQHINDLVEAMGRLVIPASILWFALCIACFLVSIYLIKPLFAYREAKREGSIEVTKNDCPELFSLIKEISNTLGCKKPSRVYLSSAVNACIFHDISLMNLFIPARRNLEIGLGLFQDTNKEELKAIISHELGHIAQPAYRSIVLPRQIIIGLIYDKDWWDRMCFSLYNSGILWGLFHYAGAWTINVTNWLKEKTFSVFKHEEQAYRELSRLMEFDADESACRCTSSDVQISTLCKLEVLTSRNEAYNKHLTHLINNYQRLVNNYFAGNELFERHRHPADHIELSYKVLLTEPVSMIDVKSRVSINDIYDTHPSLEKRIEHAHNLDSEAPGKLVLEPSWQLIPKPIIDKVSNSAIQHIVNNYGREVTLISEYEFDRWLKLYNEEIVIPVEMREFFEREILDFNPDEIPINKNVDNPFNDENRRLVKETAMALHDLLLLQELLNADDSDQTELSYDNHIFPSYNAPVETQADYYNSLTQARDILDKNVYSYLISNLDEDNANLVMSLYSAIHYLNNLSNNELQNINSKRQSIIEEVNNGIDKESVPWLRGMINTHIDQIRDFALIIKYQERLFSQSTNEKALNDLFDYVNSLYHLSANSISTVFLNQLFRVDDFLSEIVSNTKWWCKKNICSLAISILEKKGLYSAVRCNYNSSITNYDVNESSSGHNNTTIQPRQEKSHSFKKLKAIIPALVVLFFIFFPIFFGINNYDKILFHKTAPRIDNIQISANECTDGIIIFTVPTGSKCNRELLEDEKMYVHIITNEQEGYKIRIMGDDRTSYLIKEEFDSLYVNMQSKDKDLLKQTEESSDHFMNNMRILEKTTSYKQSNGGSTQIWRFIVAESVQDKGSPICIISCWSPEECDPPLTDLIKSIRIVDKSK